MHALQVNKRHGKNLALTHLVAHTEIIAFENTIMLQRPWTLTSQTRTGKTADVRCFRACYAYSNVAQVVLATDYSLCG